MLVFQEGEKLAKPLEQGENQQQTMARGGIYPWTHWWEASALPILAILAPLFLNLLFFKSHQNNLDLIAWLDTAWRWHSQ